MLYTDTVYIIPLQGSKKAKEPLQEKGSLVGAFNRIYSLLYTFDMTVISPGVCEEKAYKRLPFIHMSIHPKISITAKMCYCLLAVIFWYFIISNPIKSYLILGDSFLFLSFTACFRVINPKKKLE